MRWRKHKPGRKNGEQTNETGEGGEARPLWASAPSEGKTASFPKCGLQVTPTGFTWGDCKGADSRALPCNYRIRIFRHSARNLHLEKPPKYLCILTFRNHWNREWPSPSDLKAIFQISSKFFRLWSVTRYWIIMSI